MLSFWWARKCWFAFAPSCRAMYTCLQLDHISIRNGIQQCEREHLQQQQEKSTTSITLNWWNFHRPVSFLHTVRLSGPQCAYIVNFMFDYLNTHNTKRHKINASTIALWYCPIQFQHQLVINIFHFCILFGVSKFKPISERVMRTQQRSAASERERNTSATHIALEVKVLHCSDMILCILPIYRFISMSIDFDIRYA